MADDFGMGYALGADSGGNNGSSMFNGDAFWGIILLALLFGRNGFGGGFGGGGDGNPVTTADLCSQFNFNDLQNSVRGIQQGICDSTYALNNSIMGGFHGVDNAICNLGYNIQTGFNTLGYQQKDCCCETQRLIERGFCDTNTNIANQTRDIIENNNCNTRAILDFLTNDKIEALRAENQSLRFSASQDRQNALLTTAMQAQTNQLIDRIAPYPIPSFNVCAPYQFGGYGYGGYGWNNGNNGCGCGCG